MFRTAIWLGVILCALTASAATKPKPAQYEGKCESCEASVVFTPYRITTNGTATVTNRVRVDRTLLFKCPACKAKNTVQNEVWTLPKAKAQPYQPKRTTKPLPPLPPGFKDTTANVLAFIKPSGSNAIATIQSKIDAVLAQRQFTPASVGQVVSVTLENKPADPPFPAQTNVVVRAQHLAGHVLYVEVSTNMVTWFTGLRVACTPNTHTFRADFAWQRRGQFFRSRNEPCAPPFTAKP